RYQRILAELADNLPDREGLKNYGLGRSYRTAQPVLEFVDAAIEAIGPEAFGLAEPPGKHEGDRARPGLVALWRPVGVTPDEDEEAEVAMPGEDTWLPGSEREMADRIAAQVKAWLRDGYPLVKGE